MSSARLVAAEFDSAERLRAAVDRLTERGLRVVDACSPYEVRGLAEKLHRRRSPLPKVAFAGGLIGAALGYFIQWYVNAWSYPLNAGGRPPHAPPSFIFVTFETMVLCAAGAVFVGLFVILGLPRYHHPLWEIDGFDRVSSDRFWVVVESDTGAAAVRAALAPVEPIRAVALETDR